MFLCVKRLNTFQRSSVKNKYCTERIEAKVVMCICLLKVKIITVDYCKLMINNRYNT